MQLAASTDKIQVVTSAAVATDSLFEYVDASTADPPVVKGSTSGRTAAAISTATTTDAVPSPAASTLRRVISATIRNKSTTTNQDVTVQALISAVAYELVKVTLRPGETLQYEPGLGWYVLSAATRLDARLRVVSDVTNNTTSFADITGLTQAIKSGKHYGFEAMLFILSAATTTGVQLGVNGPTMTGSRFSAIETVTGSATAAALSVPVGDITALDTAIVVQTTGPANVVQAVVTGWVNPSADGTFAMRVKSEVASSTVTVKAGSWLRIFELDN